MHRRSAAAILTAAFSFATMAVLVAESPQSPAATSAGRPAPPAEPLHKIAFSSCHVDGKYVAMTFDDGPSAENTPRLLDILKARNIKATFFMIGENAARYPKIVERVVAEGHEIGSHSWSHPLLSKMTDDQVREQIEKTQDAIIHASGYPPGLLRPPYGGFTDRQRRWANSIFGYEIVLWDVDPLDWKIRDSAHVQSEILKQTKPGSIILSHDIHKTTVDAMPATLDALLGQGYSFVTVSELIAMDRPISAKAPSSAVSAGEKPSASFAPVNFPPPPTGIKSPQ